MYRVLYKKSVEKDLRKVSQAVRVAIIQKILLLVDNPQPNGAIKLRGATNLYRIRHTDYRIIYSVDSGECIILVIKVGHRKEVYRDF